MRDLMQRYTWADAPSLDLVWCVSVVTGSDETSVIRLFGGNPSHVQKMTFAEATRSGDPDMTYFYAQVFSHGNHTVVIENNSWTGSIPETARRGSGNGGEFFSAFYNGEARRSIVHAVDGQLDACFEPASPYPDPWAKIPEWAETADFAPGHIRAASLALMEAQTGVSFDRTWLDTPLATYRIPAPDELYPDADAAYDH